VDPADRGAASSGPCRRVIWARPPSHPRFPAA